MNKKNHFFSPKKLSLAIASALVSMAAIANDNNPEPILVQATKPAANTPFSTAVTSADITSQRAATSDTASLLRDIPGISLYGAGGVSSLPAIHGLADDRLRIKVDGMDLLSSCPNHMNSPLSYLDPSQVETLKVYAGITPVSVGGDSIGGTIIADTAAPEFAAPGQGHLLKGQVGAFYRSNNNARGGNLTATYATEMLNITYSGATTQADNYTAGGDFKTTSATGRPGHTLPLDEVGSTAYKANNHALNLALKHDNHLFEVKYSFQDIPYEGFPNQRMDMLDNTAHRINLHYLGEFGWGSLDARAYRETVTHFMNFGDDKQFWYGDAPGMPMHTESKNTGGVVKANIKLTAQDLLRVGGEYQRYQLDDWWPASGTGMMMAPNTFWNINDGQRDRTALFGEWESRINPAWTTLLGARYEQVKTDAGPVQGYSMMYAADANTFNARNRERTDNNWDATALARYTADATRTVEFGYAMKTRSPNLYERYSWSRIGMALEMNNFLGDGNGYLGDPDLKPEKAHTLSATFDWHAPDRAWEFKATPYYSHVTDYIDARRCGSGTGMMAPCGGVANNT
ncbi:MAG TPA: TonB-dependent receptor, partial [Rugosibacter sp.]|nr:TonB-dependent receptor [Rugosibacter sp.]